MKAKEFLFKKLETKLHTTHSYLEPYHEDSIMEYGKICDCDDGYLCSHRREWLFDFLKSNLEGKLNSPSIIPTAKKGETIFNLVVKCSWCHQVVCENGVFKEHNCKNK